MPYRLRGGHAIGKCITDQRGAITIWRNFALLSHPHCPRVPGVISSPQIWPCRSIFELRHARTINAPPADLPLGTIEATGSDKNAHWHTNSDILIEALGPIGQEYAKPQKYANRLDISFTDAVTVARNKAVAQVEAVQNAARVQSREGQLPNHKDALAWYLDAIAPSLAMGNADNMASDHALQNYIEHPLAKFVHKKGFDLRDLLTWSWILQAESADRAASRLQAAHLTHENNDQGGTSRVPNTVFLFLLRRQGLSPKGLRILLGHAWHLLLGVEDHFVRNAKMKSLELSGRRPRKTVPHASEDPSSFREDIFILMIIRLYRQAHKVCPAALESITALCCRYINGLNFHRGKTTLQDQARLSFTYNTMLALLSVPTSIRPFVSIVHQQRAQFALLRRMNEFEPPLVIDNRGFRAFVRIQLMHKKTLREREWANLKAQSWPPYKEEKYGLDAFIGPDSGISRAKTVLDSAAEAGYAPTQWSEASTLLSGWDTDDTPTIQTRAIIDSPHEKDDDDCLIWASRIRATRTLDEAWSVYEQFDRGPDKASQRIDREIFEKIVSKDQQHEQDPLDSEITDKPLPGDGREIFPPPTNPQAAIYLRTPIPTPKQFVDRVLSKGTRPDGRFLVSLLKYSPSIESGLKTLMASGLKKSHVQTVLDFSPGSSSFKEAKLSIDTIPDDIFNAIIVFFARSAARSLRRQQEHTDLTQKFAGWKFSNTLESSPFMHAIHLTRLRCPKSIHAWKHLIGTLSRDPGIVFQQGEMSRLAWRGPVLAWHLMLQIIGWMHEARICLGLDIFKKLCIGLDKAVRATDDFVRQYGSLSMIEPHFRSIVHETLDDGLPLLQTIFRDLVAIPSIAYRLPMRLGKQLAKIEAELEHENDSTDLGSQQSTATAYKQHIIDKDEGGVLGGPNKDKDYLPPSALLPRLPEVPTPATLHAFIRILGLRREYSGLLELIEWMALYFDEIGEIAREQRGGMRLFRRCLIATRAFLEAPYAQADGITSQDPTKHVPNVDIDVSNHHTPAPEEIVQSVRAVIEEHEKSGWGSWPTDEEVSRYWKNSKSKR